MSQTKNSFGDTQLTNYTEEELKDFLSDEALTDLKKNVRNRPSVRSILMDFINNKIEIGQIFTIQDLFILLHKEGHTFIKYGTLRTTISRILTEASDLPFETINYGGRKKVFQRI